MNDDEITIEKLTGVFIKIREKRAELSKRYKEEDAALIEEQDKIKNYLLQYCKDNGVNSGTTAGGQFIRSVKTTYWTSDWESMNKFIVEENHPEFLTKSLHQSNLKAFMEANPDVTPPGLNVNTEYVMTIKKPRAKGGAKNE